MNPWRDTEALPEHTTWLIEASAGTGKTFQIASLVLRLVAEHGLPVDRILAITFTNAATGELRDRVRRRLREALEAARGPGATTEDPVIVHVLGAAPRAEIVRRLELALRSFDLAPISTIHGFSQRMLQELAFDSGQDPELELMSDAGDVVEEIVDDTLAALYASASPAELAALEGAGVNRASLLDVAKRMSGPTKPGVLPAEKAPGAGDSSADVLRGALGQAREWTVKAAAMQARWSDGLARGALGALEQDVRDKRFKTLRDSWMSGSIRKVSDWLAAGAGPGDTAQPAFARLRATALRGLWKGAPSDLEARPWGPIVEEIERFYDDHAEFHGAFAPLVAFAATARERVEAELERRRVLTFDAILSRLAERVAKDGGADSPLAARIRERFDAVFVDEFQDTDDAQWSVLRAAFHGHRRLFLIGDPKQAIYAFRGADVHVYLAAAGVVDPDQRRTMDRNWRSDGRAVEATNALFRAGSSPFDQEAIDYVHVVAQHGDRLRAVGPPSGLDLRWVDDRARGGDEGQPISSKAEGLAARLAVREVVAWLDGARGEIDRDLGDERPPAIEPGDLAVLVNGHHEGAAVLRALGRAGVPAVAAAHDSVIETPVARWLAAWLDAVAGGGRDRAARTAVVTPLFGWAADELAWALSRAGRELDGAGDAGDAVDPARAPDPSARDWNAWTERLQAAADRWPKQGFARTFDAEASALGVVPRVLALPEGERHATDLRHLFELLHVEERTRRHGPRALADWLCAQAGAGGEEAAQRLESDARAVRIETVHASKGLEYPVVLLPFGWSARKHDDKGRPIVVRGDHGAELHVGGKGTEGRTEAHARAVAEERREALRKQYVALTRARHRTIAWYGPIGAGGAAASGTAIGRLLMRDPDRDGFDDGAMPDFGKKGAAGAWPKAKLRLDQLVARSEGSLTWSAELPVEGATQWVAPARSLADPARAAWPADAPALVGPWMVASFTSLASGSAAPDRDERMRADAAIAEAAGVARRAEAGEGPAGLVRPPRIDPPGAPLRRIERGRGTQYGTCVHELLEALDFATGVAKDGRSLGDLVNASAARVGLRGDELLTTELVELLPTLIATPLDSTREDDAVRGLPPGFSLRDLALGDRLDELAFDLRLGDGTAWRRDPGASAAPRSKLEARPGCVDPGKVYEAILASPEAHRRGVAPWVDHLRARRDAGRPIIEGIAGILTGSIDLVFRATVAGDRRYFLADYKTNRIGDSEAFNYAGPWLEWEMAKAGYPLQALLYTLALHRHLKTRLRGYDYDRDVGGYLYLFLKGMSGPDTPRDPATGRCLGVLGDRWPKETVEALDRALSPEKEAAQ